MILRNGRLWILSLIVLTSVGLGGCAGSFARDVADASNRPGGLLAVVPCRHDPDIGGQLRTMVTGSDTRKKCDAVWTHPTATQDQLVEDMTACSKAAFWVLSPTAAQDQRLACMESKSYRRDTPENKTGSVAQTEQERAELIGAAKKHYCRQLHPEASSDDAEQHYQRCLED